MTFFKNDPQMWLYYLLTGIIVGQLLFVASPLNCRGNFLTYVFMYLIGMKFVLLALTKINVNKTVVNTILAIVLLFMAVNYQYKMYTNHEANLQRVEKPSFYNKGVLFTKYVPYRTFVWANDLNTQQNPSYWKLYLEKH